MSPLPPAAEDQRSASLRRLLEVTHALAAEIDLKRVLPAIVQAAADALGCERASLYRYDPATDELYTSVVTELELSEIRKRTDRGISGHVARSRELANVSNPAHDPRWDSQFDQQTGFHTRNILAAPLISPGGGLLGVLQLLNKAGGDFDRDDEELVTAFSQHAAVALDRAQLVAEIERRKEIETSLNVARNVQRGFMPERLPTIAGYEAATWWFPNQAIGGDYCDVIALADGRTLCCIADVSGHGLGPSLIMASVRAALRALLLQHASSRVLLEQLSRALAGDLQHGMFITMFLGILDSRSQVLEYANAGHAPALHFAAATGHFRELEATGFPIGVVDTAEYPHGPSVALAPGDVLVLCTDGIVEAMNARGEQFGLDRLKRLTAQFARQGTNELVEQIGAAVSAHYPGDSPPDDLTIVVLQREWK